MNLFIMYLKEDPFFFFSWIIIVSFSICMHEYAHAWISLKMGDDTAAREGHLTLNPMKQMGPQSVIMLLLIGIAWGAVPVNPGRVRKRFGSALVSFAGPGMNLLLCVVFSLIAALLGYFLSPEMNQNISRFFALGCIANGVLFFFNMLPVPMFDGWSFLAEFLPSMKRLNNQQMQTFTWIFLMLVFITPLGGLIWEWGGIIGKTLIAFWNGLLG